VKLVVAEAESAALAAAIADDAAVASVVAGIELRRAVQRRIGAQAFDAVDALIDAVAQIPLSEAIATKAARLEPPELRTLDAVHLASALEVGADLDAFVCYDERLAAAASRAGLAVLMPA
jgi:uncharacterized protein